MTFEEVREIALSFPGCVEGTSYGQPSFLVNKKFFTRVRRDDASLVLLEVSFDEREMLIEAEPETFHFTAHYKDSHAVLARIATLHPGSMRAFLDRRWRRIAPKKLVRERDAAMTVQS
ncbi:MAG TPA: MmcQ/YjbR family DNA-binding protein [Caulobacteraceae bacterium]|nr:MmcQ/YjbR family DNA-binding protein [Caulobacteraceae bacterium]